MRALKLLLLLLVLLLAGYSQGNNQTNTTQTDQTKSGSNFTNQTGSGENITDPTTDAAISFLKSHSLLQGFVEKHPGMVWYSYSYDNEVSIYGYSNTSVWLSAKLSAFIQGSEYNFTLEMVWSNDYFGQPQHEFGEIMNVALGNEDVKQFTEQYPDVNHTIQLSYDVSLERPYSYRIDYNSYIYYANEAVAEQNSTTVSPSQDFRAGNCGSYYWLTLVIDDATEEVTEIHGTTTADLTEEEVTSIVASNEDVGSWLAGLENYHIDVSYNGWGSWGIYIYSLDTADYASMNLNDTTSEITELYIFIPVPATKTEGQLLDLMKEDSRVSQWMTEVKNYETYFYYDNQGTWYVYLYDPVIYQNYVWARIDDPSGQIEEASISLIHSNLSLDEVYGILANADLENFLSTYPDARIYIYYSNYVNYYEDKNGTSSVDNGNSQGDWYVYIYSPTYVEARLSLTIDDASGKIIERQETYPQITPTADIHKIEDILNTDPTVKSFNTLVEVEYQSTYYYMGKWYSWASGTAKNGTDYYLSVMIDDASQSVDQAEIYSSICWGIYYAEDTANIRSGNQMNGQDQQKGIPLTAVLDTSTSNSGQVPGYGLVGILGLVAIIAVRRYRLQRK